MLWTFNSWISFAVGGRLGTSILGRAGEHRRELLFFLRLLVMTSDDKLYVAETNPCCLTKCLLIEMFEDSNLLGAKKVVRSVGYISGNVFLALLAMQR